MYRRAKRLMHAVRVDPPDPKFGNMLLEPSGGANGELAAAMQYSIQGNTVRNRNEGGQVATQRRTR